MLAAPMPKRLLTTFTSSGWETSLGIGSVPFCLPLHLCLGAIGFQNAGYMLRGEVVVKVVVHLYGRSPAAGADALDFFKGKETVGGDALVPNAQLFLKALVKIVGAAQHAADVGADLHVVFARRLEAQHRVVRGHVTHLKFGNADPLGYFRNHRVGEIADLILRV